MRVTKKFLAKWLTEKYKELNKNFECFEVVSTRFTLDQYENGACYLYFNIRELTYGHTHTILCFMPIWAIEQHLNAGYELYIDRQKRFSDEQISLRKKEI